MTIAATDRRQPQRRESRMFQRLVTVSVLALAMSLASAIPSAAQSEGTFTLTVGTYLCDVNPYETSDATCEPAAGVVVVVTLESGEPIGSCTSESEPTPNGGVFSGCGVDGVPFNATLLVTEDTASIPAGYVPINSPQVFQTTDLIPGGGDGPVLDLIYVQAVEPPAATPQDTVSPTASVTDDAQGWPAAIYTGSCDDLGNVAAPLPAIHDPQGPPVGQASAIEASTTSTIVPVPLDLLIDQPHAIVVLESTAPSAADIACGDIGGVDNDDGELVIGLQQVGDSDFIGMAYLAYSPADPSQTAVSIFLAPGLATAS
jgi:hypothetical protein